MDLRCIILYFQSLVLWIQKEIDNFLEKDSSRIFDSFMVLCSCKHLFFCTQPPKEKKRSNHEHSIQLLNNMTSFRHHLLIYARLVQDARLNKSRYTKDTRKDIALCRLIFLPAVVFFITYIRFYNSCCIIIILFCAWTLYTNTSNINRQK